MAAVAVRYPELQALNTTVLSISTDSWQSHKVWQEEELSKMVPGGVPFPMLADQGGHVGALYGVYDEQAGVQARGHFVISPDGVILGMQLLGASVGRSVDELIRQIKAFQHARATGEAIPAGWQPGQPAIKSSPELVGKVWQVWKPERAAELQPA